MTKNKIASIVAAAGEGRRAGGEVSKPYQKLGGAPLLLKALSAVSIYGPVQPVIRKADFELYHESVAALKNRQNIYPPVAGGATRAASVFAGLQALRDQAPDIVLIHDGARPFIPPGLIELLLETLDECAGAAPALPITDSLKKLDHQKVLTINRTNIFRVQTPQAFHYPTILKAYQKYQCEQNKNITATDDLAVLEMIGETARLVAGDERNIKITEAGDFEKFQRIHHIDHHARMGLGVDAHRFGAGNHIWLGGHRIAHDQGIAAHSDGDVVLHALADALFGITAAGDLGSHFPSSDPQWRGVRSQVFVAEAIKQLEEAGFALINVDITVICAKPAIALHRQAIREQIATLLNMNSQQISVKATTTDGMGLTGNNEGIAAQAIVCAGRPNQ